jgi:hypothetical protein
MWVVSVAVCAGAPALPNIPAYTTNVTQAPYNAHGDGVTDNTTAIQDAIDDVSTHGGGTVEIPGPGVYMTGPLTMKSKINFQIDSGATLRMLPYSTWYSSYSTTPLLSLLSLTNIEISGGGGIDGQGLNWWSENPGSGLYMIYFSSCNTVLVQNVTCSNAPAQQIVFKNSKGGNITIQGVTILAPSSHALTNPSHNTDGIDLVGTNCLVQNCDISTGDDNIALGSSSSSAVTSDVLVTNCTFGSGHGMSIGSNTAGGVSNLTVINCTFSGTDYGIRMKSDDLSSGGSGEGGIAQNLYYYNLGMTNLGYYPICIYSYYKSYGDPLGITPADAAATNAAAVTANTPIWRNIIISNITATVAAGGGGAGIIWARTEMPATNISLIRLNITAPGNFELYNTRNIQIVDSQITPTLVPDTFSLYNAEFAISNSAPTASVFSMDGLTGANSLALYGAQASMNDAAAIGMNPLMLNASSLSDSTSLALPSSSVVNFTLGSNTAAVAVTGNLTLNSTINLTNGSGFASGTYTIFTYTGVLLGSPVLGAQPAGYSCSLKTNTLHQVNAVLAPSQLPTFGGIQADPGGSVVMTGSGGITNGIYYVLASTNVALPLSQWTYIATNGFDGSGRFAFTNSPNPGWPQSFYALKLP